VAYLQFDGFVPHDGVARQRVCFNVDHVDVALVRSDIDPLGLEREVTERYPTDRPTDITQWKFHTAGTIPVQGHARSSNPDPPSVVHRYCIRIQESLVLTLR